MDTNKILKVGHVLMAVGGSIFSGGVGLCLTARIIDRRSAKAIAEQSKLDISVESAKRKALLEEEAISAQAEKDRIYSEKLSKMDKNQFAKHHAEANAKASEDAIFKAKQMVSDAEKKLAEAEQACTQKITEAIKSQTDAERKYNELLKEYKNRDEVLEAKKKLDDLAKAKSEMKTALETLI